MSEQFYCLKALFPHPLKKKEITNLKDFFKEMFDAADYWQKHEENFPSKLPELFPTIALYLKGLNLHNLSGIFLYSEYIDNRPTNDDLFIDGIELTYRGEQSQYLDMNRLAQFLKTHFNAIDARWISESEVNIEDYLETNFNNEIIEDLLKHKDILPILLGINPLLDAKIAQALSK